MTVDVTKSLANDIELVCRAAQKYSHWIDTHWDMTNEDPSELRAAIQRLRAAISTLTVDPICPRCGERTYESPRTGRTCVRNECGWRERE